MPTRSSDETGGLRQLGKSGTNYSFSGPSREILEAFPNRCPERDYVIRIVFPEFTSLCPKTGQPDFGTIIVEYIPDKLCVESKSFKLYMFAYRQHQSFMETMTNAILDDLVEAASPRWLLVKGLFEPRGAARIQVFAEEYKKLGREREAEIRRAVADFRAICQKD